MRARAAAAFDNSVSLTIASISSVLFIQFSLILNWGFETSSFSRLAQLGGDCALAQFSHCGNSGQLTGSGLGFARFPVIHALGRNAQQLAHLGSADIQFFAQCSKARYAEPEGGTGVLICIFCRFCTGSALILRVCLKELPFEHNTRELVVNAIGRFLLRRARKGAFREFPLVVMLDEAHQFLDKSVGDEYNKTSLDSFGLIAKEGRKYGLTSVLATQRPRDIPEDVLSQMGMFIVHRLINERDRAVVEKACGNLDHSAATFLPTLGQGEAILVGVDSPMPLPVRIRPPAFSPESRGPDYAKHWVEKAS